MNAIKNRIRSREGASITFALLIFLVCTIISSVVIVAATASAGRMSQVAEADQRYYAVTSAAELLRSVFDGQPVNVKYVRTDTKTTTDGTTSTTTTINSFSSDVDDTDTILADASKTLAQKIANNTADTTTADKTFILTVSSSDLADTAKASLKCRIKEYVKRDGRVIFVISNPVSDDETNTAAYTLQVTLRATLSDSSTTQTTTTDSDSSETKSLNTKKIVWELDNIKKGIG